MAAATSCRQPRRTRAPGCALLLPPGLGGGERGWAPEVAPPFHSPPPSAQPHPPGRKRAGDRRPPCAPEVERAGYLEETRRDCSVQISPSAAVVFSHPVVGRIPHC
ncbi:Hypothetical predicted protein [Podarcis lilfordi]|uniref:Uncharacterized protein n=1 Tax=Podarcis lilfordi TaxID=74358 RepID=A0AA35PJB1_9SAUR|nr:Hypothetical predicted protein [Podarcis lilfordi]